MAQWTKSGFLVLILYVSRIYGYESVINYTEPHVITTPNYPDPYPPHINSTWQWSKPSGIWAVLFDDLDVSCQDFVYIEDVKSKKPQPFGCTHSTEMPTYIHGPLLRIRFTSRNNHANHRGFKLQVLSGVNLDDVKIQVYDLKQMEKEESEHTVHHDYILLGIVLVMICLIIIIGVSLTVTVAKRRRRRRDNGTVSVAVSVNHIQRDSGVTYKRSPSTSESVTSNDATTNKTVDTDRRKILRSASQRSWTARATVTTRPNAAVDNLYTPINQQENQINCPKFDPLSKHLPCTNVYPITESGYETHINKKNIVLL